MDFLFPALFDHPENVYFDQQEADETIELLLRKHWITNVGWIIVGILLFLLPAMLPTIAPLFSNVVPEIPLEIATAFLILWYMLAVAYIVESYLHWYFNVYIVTNQHLVDVNFHNLLNRDIVSIKIYDVQSVRPKVSGVFGSLFYYGDLVIESAAENQRIDFLNVPQPDFVADRIQDLQGAKDRRGGNEPV